MAVFAQNDLKKWRVSQNVSAAELAEKVGCDVTTIYRYESGELKPNPDVMYRICEELGDVNKWCLWMRSEYPTSYARVHPETPDYELAKAVCSMIAEMRDVHNLESEILRETVASNEDFQNGIRKEIDDLLSRAQLLHNIFLVRGGDKSE